MHVFYLKISLRVFKSWKLMYTTQKRQESRFPMNSCLLTVSVFCKGKGGQYQCPIVAISIFGITIDSPSPYNDDTLEVNSFKSDNIAWRICSVAWRHDSMLWRVALWFQLLVQPWGIKAWMKQNRMKVYLEALTYSLVTISVMVRDNEVAIMSEEEWCRRPAWNKDEAHIAIIT